MRVVVADDHPLFRRALADSIKQRADLELVGEAANGREALSLIAATAPDVAVLDMRMPELDGQRVLNALVRDQSATRVLFLTANVESPAVYEALGAGASGYLAKEADGCDLRRDRRGRAG